MFQSKLQNVFAIKTVLKRITFLWGTVYGGKWECPICKKFVTDTTNTIRQHTLYRKTGPNNMKGYCLSEFMKRMKKNLWQIFIDLEKKSKLNEL